MMKPHPMSETPIKNCGFYFTEFDQILMCSQSSMDWFRGKSAENRGFFFHQKKGCPADSPSHQSIEINITKIPMGWFITTIGRITINNTMVIQWIK